MNEGAKLTSNLRDRRLNRDCHFLDGDGRVACNPRDREAAHRAEMEGIATDDPKSVTCRKCLAAMRRMRQAPPSS